MALRSEALTADLNDPVAIGRAIEHLCRPGVVEAFVQPVVRPADQLVVGYEALARMPVEPFRSPYWWLVEAERIGLRTDLEIACLEAAAALGSPPEERLLFVNLSPSLLRHPRALALLDRLPVRLVIELTEQEAVDDYDLLRADLEPWLSRGVRTAIDDTGAGYSSLRHVIELTPDFLKLDRELVHDLDTDRNRRALVSAVVAFASEVGTSVIAEGVETGPELKVLRDTEVDLVQGYLLARPGPAWPSVTRERSSPRMIEPRGPGVSSRSTAGRLDDALARAADPKEACSAVVTHLFRQGQIMPSAYLERNGELRCMAQRGLWQVLDGMSHRAGITGRTWNTGRAIVVPDVSNDPDYLEAIPGVVSEICVPIRVEGQTFGALNVESLIPLPTGMLAMLESCAAMLADRLQAIDDHVEESPFDRAVRASTAMSKLTDSTRLPDRLIRCLRDASRMDSGGLIVDSSAGPAMAAAVGPLEPELWKLTSSDLVGLSALVNDVRSCYTGGDALGRGFVGTDSLRDGGARVVVVLPLLAQGTRLGSAVLTHSRPLQLEGNEVRPLESLANQVASTLRSSRTSSSPAEPRTEAG
jgi:EAL domain-containing protein (putative c-di-GMP-specific phosphodiesterase class I)/putative methionine-R-sulfoxide reductase with GAF domain